MSVMMTESPTSSLAQELMGGGNYSLQSKDFASKVLPSSGYKESKFFKNIPGSLDLNYKTSLNKQSDSQYSEVMLPAASSART